MTITAVIYAYATRLLTKIVTPTSPFINSRRMQAEETA